MPLSSMFIKSPAQPRKHARSLSRIALALATLATAGLFNAAHATYPGENGVIVFDSIEYQGAPSIIKRVSPGNSAVTDLATGNGPSVSPNGKKIAFLSNDSQKLYVMDINGSNVVELTNDQGLRPPSWLPDGSKVVFGRVSPNQTVELWTINPDGSDKTFNRNLEIYTTSVGRLYLAWSPLGNIYTFNGDEGLNIASDLTPTHPLISAGSASSWAPDSRSILFNSWLQDGLFEINPDGSNLKMLTPDGSGNHPSAISPDGGFIAGRRDKDRWDQKQLLTRVRAAGTPTTFAWNTPVYKTDWSRVPKNCYATVAQGGGGVLAGDVNFYASQCAIAVMPDGGVHGTLQQAIAVGPDQRLYHRALIPSLIGDQPIWTGFLPVPGGGGNPNGINAKKIAIAAAKDGSAQVVIINANDNLVYHAMRYPNGTWSGFNLLDGAGGAPNFAARDVAITINASTPTSPGNAQVIANGSSAGDVYHRVRWAAGNWTPFAPVPGGVGMNTHALAIAAGEDGNTNILATTTAADGSQGQMRQVLRDANSNWSGWVTVGISNGTTLSPSSDVAVARTRIGTAQLMFTDAAGNAYYQERTSPNVPASWQPQVSSTTIAETVGREVSISAGASAGSSSQLLLTRTFPQ